MLERIVFSLIGGLWLSAAILGVFLLKTAWTHRGRG